MAQERPQEQDFSQAFVPIPEVSRDFIKDFYIRVFELQSEGKLFPVLTRREIAQRLTEIDLPSLEKQMFEKEAQESAGLSEEQETKWNAFEEEWTKLGESDADVEPFIRLVEKVTDFFPKTNGSQRIYPEDFAQHFAEIPTYDSVRQAMGFNQLQTPISLAALENGIVYIQDANVNGQRRTVFHYLLSDGVEGLSQEERKGKVYEPGELMYACVVPGDPQPQYFHFDYGKCPETQPLQRKITIS